jgi:hypothetical protein
LQETLVAALSRVRTAIPNDGGIALNVQVDARAQRPVRQTASDNEIQPIAAVMDEIPTRRQKSLSLRRHRQITGQCDNAISVTSALQDPPENGTLSSTFGTSLLTEDQQLQLSMQPTDNLLNSRPVDDPDTNARPSHNIICVTSALQDPPENGTLSATSGSSFLTEDQPVQLSMQPMDNLVNSISVDDPDTNARPSQNDVVSSTVCQTKKRKSTCEAISRSKRKQVNFSDTLGKPLKTIQHYFKINPVIASGMIPELQPTGEPSVQSNYQLPLLVGVPDKIISATKVNIAACWNKHGKQALTCGSVQLTEQDLLSLLPRKQLFDTVSAS